MVELKALGSKKLENSTSKYIQLGFHLSVPQGHFLGMGCCFMLCLFFSNSWYHTWYTFEIITSIHVCSWHKLLYEISKNWKLICKSWSIPPLNFNMWCHWMPTLRVEGRNLWDHSFFSEFNEPNGIHKGWEWKKQAKSTQTFKRIMFK